ncbi:hypothetical protein [Acinetobacter larvae]|uniref:Uncharacterized protein n=1 Tax=Acinetobacter larvae TaxID=1789224 RepID=A0A1B2LZV8_9GAMM|nr:hypothetical protein [Acinetobacter larvae]AOA58477.1 hypothetical protein BFG52_09005 [Acinetobacter larvae]
MRDISDLLAISDDNHPDFGMNEVSFECGRENKEEDEAKKSYQCFRQILDQAKKNGWNFFIDLDKPRITGKDSYELLNHNLKTQGDIRLPSLIIF